MKTKKELALLYFPESTPETARHHLMSWIAHCKPLKQALRKTGYRTENRYFTSVQERLIYQYLGEP